MGQVAVWLDTTFAQFDAFFFDFWHSVAESIGLIFTPIMEAVSLTGTGGICMIILALLLLCFPKTRKSGLCIAFAIAIGAIITNAALKPLVARTRPYEASSVFREYWQFVGAHSESDLSFPSGHTTATVAAMLALVFSGGKKYLYPAVPYIVLMCVSRNYLVAHYATDIIAGFIIGAVAAILAALISTAIFNSISTHKDSNICKAILTYGVDSIFKGNSSVE